MVCLDVYLFDDQEVDQLERIAVPGSYEVPKDDLKHCSCFNWSSLLSRPA
jgi:hypothetical protein